MTAEQRSALAVSSYWTVAGHLLGGALLVTSTEGAFVLSRGGLFSPLRLLRAVG